MAYCIYLRKSRQDLEAEAYHPGDTLAKHEQMLTELAVRMGLVVTAVYREVVSGDTISARPMMQQLLQEVLSGQWQGVLVMEIERLARGDTEDQGRVAKAFQLSGTKIITPIKTYDPLDEGDEEYMEFGLFMARREYQMIKRRMQRGRMASALMGKYIGNVPPYGYQRIKLPNTTGYSLSPQPRQAEVVRLIFCRYLGLEDTPPMGTGQIAKLLDAMGEHTAKNGTWTSGAVSAVLRNPVYMGKIKIRDRRVVKHLVDGVVVTSRPRTQPQLLQLVQGLHPPLVSEEVFQSAQKKLDSRSPKAARRDRPLQNPLAGLVKCGLCGHTMSRRVINGQAYLECRQPNCPNVRSALAKVEDCVLHLLQARCRPFNGMAPSQWEAPPSTAIREAEQQAVQLSTEMESLCRQQERLCSLLEQGIYDPSLFKQRQAALRQQEAALAQRQAVLSAHLEQLRSKQHGTRQPLKIERFTDLYPYLTAAQKQRLLSAMVEKIVYTKTQRGTRGNHAAEQFTLDLYPKY